MFNDNKINRFKIISQNEKFFNQDSVPIIGTTSCSPAKVPINDL